MTLIDLFQEVSSPVWYAVGLSNTDLKQTSRSADIRTRQCFITLQRPWTVKQPLKAFDEYKKKRQKTEPFKKKCMSLDASFGSQHVNMNDKTQGQIYF